jgi:glucokinase
MNATQTDLSGQQCVLAVDAGGSVLKAALVSQSGRILIGSDYRLPVDSAGSLPLIEQAYVELAAQGRQAAAQRGLDLSGIGVSIPGPFDYANGFCLMTHKYQAIYKVPMRPWFARGAGAVPVRFVHDSTAFLLGATWQSRWSDCRRVGAVLIGTGLGFASLFDGEIFSNPQGGPGISIYARSYRDGTAEDYVSRRGILWRYRLLQPAGSAEDIDVRELADRARQGEAAARQVFADTGEYLAEILHEILREHDFEVLLLGGQIAKSAELFLPRLQAGLADLPSLRAIEPAEQIDDAPLLGVARACWQIRR